jgi:hypothetical protein
MTDGWNDRFRADPGRFLSEHIVISPTSDKPAGTYDFNLVRQGIDDPARFRLEFVDNPAAVDELCLRAHWVPYEPGEYRESHDLNADADLVFTAKLTGCTLCAWDDPMRMAHVNKQRVEGDRTFIDQGAINDAIDDAGHGEPTLKLTKAHYMPTDKLVNFTAVSVRNKTTNRFEHLIQRYETDGARRVVCRTARDVADHGVEAFAPHAHGFTKIVHGVRKRFRSAFRGRGRG